MKAYKTLSIAMKKKKEKPESNQVNEPQVAYNNRVIMTTFAELEERDREFTRRMTYAERMEYLQKLIYNLFGPDLSEQEQELKKGKLTIRKTE